MRVVSIRDIYNSLIGKFFKNLDTLPTMIIEKTYVKKKTLSEIRFSLDNPKFTKHAIYNCAKKTIRLYDGERQYGLLGKGVEIQHMKDLPDKAVIKPTKALRSFNKYTKKDE